MCFDMHVNLPVVASFLLLYSLRVGSTAVFFWTVMRSFFTLFFFIVVILEGLVKRKSPFGQIFIYSEEPTTEENIFHFYYCSVAMVLAEAFLFVFCFYLAHAVLCSKPQPMCEFLTCRFVTWLIEVINLTVLTLVHKLLIGWYIGMLMSIILEFYGFIVTYSYYIELMEYEGSQMGKPSF